MLLIKPCKRSVQSGHSVQKRLLQEGSETNHNIVKLLGIVEPKSAVSQESETPLWHAKKKKEKKIKISSFASREMGLDLKKKQKTGVLRLITSHIMRRWEGSRAVGPLDSWRFNKFSQGSEVVSKYSQSFWPFHKLPPLPPWRGSPIVTMACQLPAWCVGGWGRRRVWGGGLSKSAYNTVLHAIHGMVMHKSNEQKT